MRIGILTFWWSGDNYGQQLQCYALQKHLRDAGHDAYLVRYDPRTDGAGTFCGKLRKAMNPVRLARHVRRKFNAGRLSEQNAGRQFARFRERHIVQSERVYNSYRELKDSPPEADCYIVGSDQVWNFSFYGSGIKRRRPVIHAYFLDFGPPHALRLSYAASWSVASLDGQTVEEIRPLLARFNAVSVREEQGIGLCRQCGRDDARWVCDPTLLLDAGIWRSLYRIERPRCPAGDSYILLYMLANHHSFDIQKVYDFAGARGLQVVYVTGNGVLDGREKCFATVPEWLSLVDNARYVVTNSFHCCVFAVLFGRRFGVVPLTGEHGGMNSRLESLFSRPGIGGRWIEGNNLAAALEGRLPSAPRSVAGGGAAFLREMIPPPPPLYLKRRSASSCRCTGLSSISRGA